MPEPSKDAVKPNTAEAPANVAQQEALAALREEAENIDRQFKEALLPSGSDPLQLRTREDAHRKSVGNDKSWKVFVTFPQSNQVAAEETYSQKGDNVALMNSTMFAPDGTTIDQRTYSSDPATRKPHLDEVTQVHINRIGEVEVLNLKNGHQSNVQTKINYETKVSPDHRYTAMYPKAVEVATTRADGTINQINRFDRHGILVTSTSITPTGSRQYLLDPPDRTGEQKVRVLEKHDSAGNPMEETIYHGTTKDVVAYSKPFWGLLGGNAQPEPAKHMPVTDWDVTSLPAVTFNLDGK